MAKPKSAPSDAAETKNPQSPQSEYDLRKKTATVSGKQYRETWKSSYPTIWKSVNKGIVILMLIALGVLYLPAYGDLILGWRRLEINPGQSFELVIPQGFVLDWEVQQQWFDWGEDEVSVTTLKQGSAQIATFSSNEDAEVKYRLYRP